MNGKMLKYLLLITLLGILFWYSLPSPLFDKPYSTVVFDKKGELLGARIADDGQWRFPPSDSLPAKYTHSLVLFEDEYFRFHPGINPFSIIRALVQNIEKGKIVSGGSTISMQVIRMARENKPRTIKEKIIELYLAVRLEMRYSKEEILGLYAAHAPFGGNVVGLEAAAWRYFGRDAYSLSWAESATLAVLPNAPSLIHPGRNRTLLKAKRNRLLKKLLEKNCLDSISYSMSLLEELPDKPSPLPRYAYHLTDHFYLNQKGKRISTNIDASLQKKLFETTEIYKERLYANQITGAACIIVDVKSAEVRAYIGNLRNQIHQDYGGDVDVINAPRSSGSILKPLLFTEMLYRGELLPGMLIADIPTRFGGYSPKNYDRTFDGAVKASEALSRSLNVPAVRMLHEYGNERFHNDLKNIGLSTISFPAEHYGLSLILGGAEVSLFELAGVYSSMARVLINYLNSNGKYFRDDWSPPLLENIPANELLKDVNERAGQEQGKLGAGAIWQCMETLRELKRPDSETGWQFFNSNTKLAWKTGTSFGFRDGWAIGITPEYTIGIWTGNPDGEGRPGLTGINTAAPLLFEVLNLLPQEEWFEIPYDDLVKTTVCRMSGYKTGRYCPESDSVWISPAGLNTPPCPFHHLIHLSEDKKFRVDSDCYPSDKIIHKPWFILPPAQEWYYRKKNPLYKMLPPLSARCAGNDGIRQMEIIYPVRNSVIYIPYELDGKKGKVIFEAAHRNPEKTIYWHVDDNFIARTKSFHEIHLQPEEGIHQLYLIDEDGNEANLQFEVIEKS